jgi:hypothetical protein
MRNLFFLIFIFSTQVHAICMSPDLELKGKTKDNQKCELLVNFNEKYVSFEAGKQMCTFNLDDDSAEDFRQNKKETIIAKGYSNWFDCKVKLHYDKNGKPVRASLSSRLTLAMTFYHDECFF